MTNGKQVVRTVVAGCVVVVVVVVAVAVVVVAVVVVVVVVVAAVVVVVVVVVVGCLQPANFPPRNEATASFTAFTATLHCAPPTVITPG